MRTSHARPMDPCRGRGWPFARRPVRGRGGEEETSGAATVEAVKGSDISRVTLTEEAAKRIDVQTAAVESGTGERRPRSPTARSSTTPTATPGRSSTSRASPSCAPPITVDHIDGDIAFLTDGPAAGTKVVTVGRHPALRRRDRRRRRRVAERDVQSHDALDHQDQPAVPLPRGRRRRGDDGLRRRRLPADARRRVPRVRAAAGADPDRLPRAHGRRGGEPRHHPDGAGVQRASTGSTSCARSPRRSSPTSS